MPIKRPRKRFSLLAVVAVVALATMAGAAPALAGPHSPAGFQNQIDHLDRKVDKTEAKLLRNDEAKKPGKEARLQNNLEKALSKIAKDLGLCPSCDSTNVP